MIGGGTETGRADRNFFDRQLLVGGQIDGMRDHHDFGRETKWFYPGVGTKIQNFESTTSKALHECEK